MSDSLPGIRAIKETEESQIWASGPDNNHQRFYAKATIDDGVVDSGNTNYTTTLRGGFVLGLRDSDGKAYAYDADATNGDQKVVGVLDKALYMGDRDGTVEDKLKGLLTSGIFKDITSLIGYDKSVAAVLLRRGFTDAALEPHGSAFLMHPKARYFKATDYTVVDGDHGCMFVATAAANFTLPSLATVGKGFSALFFNGAAANMVITGAANTIVTGDAGGAVSTTITFSTANRQMGGSVLMYSDYVSDGGALGWYPLFVSGNPTYA